MSVTEGEDKPLKYPHMFRAAQVLVLSKIDLAPHVGFDAEAFLANAGRINPSLRVFQLSAKDGTGMPVFCDWVASQVATTGDARDRRRQWTKQRRSRSGSAATSDRMSGPRSS
jgi:hydrogenase nickel incorporation protein HypB